MPIEIIFLKAYVVKAFKLDMTMINVYCGLAVAKQDDIHLFANVVMSVFVSMCASTMILASVYRHSAHIKYCITFLLL